MVRQCAWCLRLIDSAGERLSPSPLPKLYEASHGICGVCGTLWMEQVIETDSSQPVNRQHVEHSARTSLPVRPEIPDTRIEIEEPITQLVLRLQDTPKNTPVPQAKKSSRIRMG